MHGEETFIWPAGCPRRFRYQCVPQLSHVYCCGEQAGQAAHKALNRYSSWRSRLKNGCKQHREQQICTLQCSLGMASPVAHFA